MKGNKIRKGLVAGVIVLFVSVSVLSSVSSKDISVSDEEMLEYDSELDDNPVTLPTDGDGYREIFTFIDAYVYDINDIILGGNPLICEILITRENSIDIYLTGWRFSGKIFHIIETFEKEYAEWVYAKYFHKFPTTGYTFQGFAFGNIEWGV